MSKLARLWKKYADLSEKDMKSSPWLDADLNKKIKDYMEKNIVAANEFMRKLFEAKDGQSFWLVQTNFMQTQWKMLSEQMKDLSENSNEKCGGCIRAHFYYGVRYRNLHFP